MRNARWTKKGLSRETPDRRTDAEEACRQHTGKKDGGNRLDMLQQVALWLFVSDIVENLMRKLHE